MTRPLESWSEFYTSIANSRWPCLVFLLHSSHLHAKSSCSELERQTWSVASPGRIRALHSGKGLSLATGNGQPQHHITRKDKHPIKNAKSTKTNKKRSKKLGFSDLISSIISPISAGHLSRELASRSMDHQSLKGFAQTSWSSWCSCQH